MNEPIAVDCADCGVIYYLTREYVLRRRADGRNFHCPNGHGQHFRKEMTEAEKEVVRLKREIDILRAGAVDRPAPASSPSEAHTDAEPGAVDDGQWKEKENG